MPINPPKIELLDKTKLEIHIWNSVPSELVPVVQDLTRRFRALIPAWLEVLRISYDAHETGSIMTCRPNYRNRWAVFTLGPSFVGEDAPERERTWIHELVHIHTGPYTNHVNNLIKDLTEDGPMRSSTLGTIDDLQEAVVTDLTIAFRLLCSDAVQQALGTILAGDDPDPDP